MTPEQQALRKAVAKMYKDKWGLSDYWLADAAIAVALETAARIPHRLFNADGTPAERRAAEEIAAAIRALMPPSPSA